MDEKINLTEKMINMFARITTLIVICAGLYIWAFWGPEVELSYSLLFEIPFIGAITAVPCTLLFYRDNLSKTTFLIREIFLYVYVNVIVFVFGKLFDWVRFDKPYMAIGLALDILLVFLLVGFLSYFVDKRTSIKMNDKLIQFQNEGK